MRWWSDADLRPALGRACGGCGRGGQAGCPDRATRPVGRCDRTDHLGCGPFQGPRNLRLLGLQPPQGRPRARVCTPRRARDDRRHPGRDRATPTRTRRRRLGATDNEPIANSSSFRDATTGVPTNAETGAQSRDAREALALKRGSTQRLTLTCCRGRLDRVEHAVAPDRVFKGRAEMRLLAIVPGETRVRLRDVGARALRRRPPILLWHGQELERGLRAPAPADVHLPDLGLAAGGRELQIALSAVDLPE